MAKKTSRIKFKRTRLILISSLILIAILLIIFFSLSESLKVREELLFEKSQLLGNWKLAVTGNFDEKALLKEWFINMGEWEVKNGYLIAKGRENYITLKAQFNGNIRIEYTAWIPKGNKVVQDLSCFLHKEIKGPLPKFYFFGFGEQRNTKTTIERVGIKVRKDYSTFIHPGTKYRIAFECVDDTFRGFINDKLILEYIDLMPLLISEKYAGLYSWGNGQHFSNFKVYVHETGTSINVFKLGDDYFYNGFPKEALKKYNEIYESHKTSETGAKALYKIGLCYHSLREGSKAMDIFNKIINNYPDLGISAYARIQKAKIYIENRSYTNALRELDKLHKIKNLGQIREELEVFYLDMLEIAQLNFYYNVALKICEKMLDLNIYDMWLKGSIYNTMGRIYINSGRLKEAKDTFDKVINNNKYSVLIKDGARARKYYITGLEGNVMESMQKLQGLISQDTTDDPEVKTVQLEALQSYFNILRDTSQIERAFKFIDEVLQRHVAFKESKNELDYYRIQLDHVNKRYDLAIKGYLEMLKSNPDSKTAYLGIIDALISKGEVNEAKRYLKDLLTLLKKDEKRNETLIGQANFLSGKVNIMSMEKYIEGLEDVFIKSTYYYTMGLGLEMDNKQSEAVKYYNRSLQYFKIPIWPATLAAAKLGRYQDF